MSDLHQLTSIDQVEPLLEQSRQQAVLIFKHSLTCPISGAAFKRYQSYLDSLAEDDPTHHTLIEIQRAREVSKEVALVVEVKHESPQAILLRHGEVAWHASHWEITEQTLRDAIDA